MNVADDFPDGIVTDTGSVALLELLESFTTIPVLGAAPLKVTVPVLERLPVTLLGFNEIPDTTGALTVSVAVSVTAPNVAVIVATFWVETPTVVTLNVALD